MKKSLLVFLLTAFLANPSAHAFYYKARCIVPQGKFKKCFLDFSQRGRMKITYKNLEYQHLNREIQGNKIKNISVGEQAKIRWEALGPGLYVFGPLGVPFLLWKKKMNLIGIEYRVGRRTTDSILVSVKKKYGFEVTRKLENMSGKSSS